jgi:hypothetical protein
MGLLRLVVVPSPSLPHDYLAGLFSASLLRTHV